jgi:Tol biopolymer transport system component
MKNLIIIIIIGITLAIIYCDKDYVRDNTLVLIYTHEYGPKWSPEGNYILFYGSKFLTTTESGNGNILGDYPWAIFAIDIEKMEPVPIYSSDKGDKYPNWYIGEDSIVFSSWKYVQASNYLYAYTLGDKEPYRLTETEGRIDENYPVYSPVSGEIAFSANFNGDFDIWKLKPGDEPGPLLSTTGYDTYPEWSPDGKELLFTSDCDGTWNIWKTDYNGGNIINLTDSEGNNLHSSWNAENNLIAFASDRSGNWDIWVMESDGSNAYQVTFDPSNETAPTWSPDGKKIAYQTDKYGTWDISIINLYD